MTVVNPKSISGITSITTASGSDNLLTIHTSDANNTERLRIDSTGTTKIVTGIVTTLTATGSAKVGTGITLSSDGDIFTVGITTIGSTEGASNLDCQLQVFANSQVGVRTGVFGDTQVAIAYTDIARFEIANKTNGGLAIGMDDDSNVSYIRHRDNGGDLAFMLRSGSQDRERLRITADGAIGIGGSNYGSSGQVIVSGGSATAAPSYQYLNRPFFKAAQTSETTLAHSAYTKVIFDTEQVDTDNAYDPSTGRFTVPSGQDGTYMFIYSVAIDDLTENKILQIRPAKNGTNGNDGRAHQYGGLNNGVVNVSRTFILHGLNAGDYVEIFAYHDEGSSQPTEQNRCFFMGYKLNVGDP